MSKKLRLKHFRGTHVADSAVDVAFFFEAKESGAAGRVAKNEALSHNGLLADNHVFNDISRFKLIATSYRARRLSHIIKRRVCESKLTVEA